MPSITPAGATPAPTPGQPLDRSSERDRAHYESVLDAEVARIVHAMREFRVTRESTLREAMHADLWGAPGFEAAMRRAVESGQVEELLGFVRLPPEVPADDRSREDLIQRMSDRLPEDAEPAS